MTRVFSDIPDRDEASPEQPDFGFPPSPVERARPPLQAEPARAEFFRAQRRPVLPVLGLLGALATVGTFLWLAQEEAPPTEAALAGDLAPVAAALGSEASLPAETTPPEGSPSPGSLAAPAPPEPLPMPSVPSVLDEPPAVAAAAPALPPTERATPARDAFSVQLLAARSEADVGASWERLRGSHPDLLASLTPSVTRTSRAPGETFYRLRAGPLRDRASAAALCKALSTRQQSCFVVSPGS